MSDIVGAATVIITPDSSGFRSALNAQMGGALGTLTGNTNALSSSLAGLSMKLDNVANTMNRAGSTLTKSITLPALAAGAAAVKVSTDFDSALREIAAVSGETDITSESMRQLRQAALDLGRDGKFSAIEVAQGFTDLARAGLTVEQQMKSIAPVTALATVENIKMADAAEKALNINFGFGRSVEELGNSVDVLAKASAATTTDMVELTDAFRFAGPVAYAAGQTFNETAAALGLLAQAGFKGSTGGTALRGAIARLAAPSKEATKALADLGIATDDTYDILRDEEFDKAKDELKDLGLSGKEVDEALRNGAAGAEASQAALARLGVQVFDTSGKMLPLNEIITLLGESGASVGDLMTIFGQRAGPGMAALIAQGPEALKELTAELDNAGGTAEQMAAVMLEGPEGAFLRLKNAAIELGIAIGESGLLDDIADLAGWFTELFHSLAETNPEVLNTTVRFVALAAAIGPITQLLAFMVGGWAQLLKVLALLTAGPLGLIAGLFAGLAAGIVLVVAKSEPLQEALSKTADLLRILFGDDVTNGAEGMQGLFESLGDAAGRLGDQIAPVVVLFNQMLAAFQIFGGDTAEAEAAVARFADQFGPLAGVVTTVIDGLVDAVYWTRNFTDQLTNLFNVFAAGDDVAQGAGEVIDNMFGNTGALVGPVRDVVTTMLELWDTLQTKVIPALQDYLPRALQEAQDIFNSTWGFVERVVLPIIQGVWEALQDLVPPAVLVALVVLKVAFESTAEAIEVLTAVLEPLATFLRDNLTPVLLTLGGAFAVFKIVPVIAAAIGGLTSAFGFLSTVGSGLALAFGAGGLGGVLTTIGSAIGGLVGSLGAAFPSIGAFTSGLSTIGGFLAPVVGWVTSLGTAIAGLVTAFNAGAGFAAIGSSLGSLTTTFSGLVAAFQAGGLAGLLSSLGAGFAGVGSALAALVSPAVAVGAAIAALVGSLVLVYQRSEMFRQAIADGWGAIQQIIGGVVDTFQGLFDVIAGIVTLDPGRIADGLGAMFDAVVGGILGGINNLVGALGQALLGFITTIPGILLEGGKLVVEWIITTLPGLILGALTTAVEGLSTVAQTVFNFGEKLIGWLGEGIQAALRTGFEFLKDLPEVLIGLVTGNFGDSGPVGVAVGTFLRDGVGKAIEFLAGAASDLGPKLVAATLLAFKFILYDIPKWLIDTAAPAIVDAVIEFGPRILEALGGAIGAIPGLLGSVLSGLGGIIWTILTGLVGLFVDWGGDLLGAVGPALGALVSNLPGWLATLGTAIWNALWAAIEFVVGNLPTALGWIIDQFQKLPGLIVEGLVGLALGLWNTVGAAIQFVRDNAIPALLALAQWFYIDMPNKIVAGLATFGTVVWNGLQAGVQFISDNWAGWVAGLLLFFSELPGKIIDALAGIGEFVWNGTKTAFGFLTDRVSELASGIVAFFTGLPARITTAVAEAGPELLEAGGQIAGSILSGIADAFSTAKDFIGDVGEKLAGFFIRAWNNIVDAINTVANDFEVDVGFGKTFGLPDNLFAGMKIMHEGGVVAGPTGGDVPIMAQAGEGIIPSGVMRGLPAGMFEALRTGQVAGVLAGNGSAPAPTQAGVTNMFSVEINVSGDTTPEAAEEAADAFVDRVQTKLGIQASVRRMVA